MAECRRRAPARRRKLRPSPEPVLRAASVPRPGWQAVAAAGSARRCAVRPRRERPAIPGALLGYGSLAVPRLRDEKRVASLFYIAWVWPQKTDEEERTEEPVRS